MKKIGVLLWPPSVYTCTLLYMCDPPPQVRDKRMGKSRKGRKSKAKPHTQACKERRFPSRSRNLLWASQNKPLIMECYINCGNYSISNTLFASCLQQTSMFIVVFAASTKTLSPQMFVCPLKYDPSSIPK